MNQEQKTIISDTFQKYAKIPDSESKKLLENVKTKSIKKNEYFVSQGDHYSSMALIISGIFRVYCIDENGNDKTLAFRTKGQFIAAFSPVLVKKEIWYSIEAIVDSEIAYLDFEQYKKIASGHSCWDLLEKNYITELFIEKEDRERSFLLDDATTRYQCFKKSFPTLENQIPQFYIASYLGITPVSLSRIRSKLS